MESDTLQANWKEKWHLALWVGLLDHVEVGHEGSIALADIDQVVAVRWKRFREFEVWYETPTPTLLGRIRTLVDRYARAA